MLPLAIMTDAQLQSYRPIWGEFAAFNNIFMGRHRVFAFAGALDVQEAGQISLSALLIACSCEHPADQPAPATARLQQSIAASGWRAATTETYSLDQTGGKFRLRLCSEPTREGKAATHLLLSFGDASQQQASYLQRCASLWSDDTTEPARPLYHFYPVRDACDPEAAELLSPHDFARRVRGKSIVAFTGAGISLSSGIPTFQGAGGLDAHFPLHEPFPGGVAHWMIWRPEELARLLGAFQAAFITAQPNAAHLALAEMEAQGTVVHVLTGNADRLHERAGSRQVHLKEPRHFTELGEGWNWIEQGEIFLVVGVSRDEHGFLSYARDHGLQVAAIAPERPSFLCAGDWFIQGGAEEVLPAVAGCLRETSGANR